MMTSNTYASTPGSRGRRRLLLLAFAAASVWLQPGRAANFYQGVATNNLPWPGGIVPYLFDTNVTATQQSVYLAGMREWELAANVHFIPRTNQSQYVILRFDYQQGTDTFIATVPPVMTVDTLSRAQVGHETGHLLGFQHEHVRTDRDGFITVNFGNLQTNLPGAEGANILGLYLIDSNSILNGPYDFESVMHYGRTLFSIDPATLDVLVPKPAYYLKYYYRIGNLALSVGDRAGAAYLYGPPTTPLSNVVTNTADVGPGTFRAALYYANDHPGTTVRFNLPITDPGYSNGVFTIYVTGELPPLVADGTVIDGSTQPGYAGKPLIAVNGSQLIPELAYTNVLFVSGLHVYAANCVVRGLAFNHFPDSGLYVQYAFASSNRIEGCYLGLAPDGTNVVGNTYEGVQLQLGASYNTIGGLNATQRNVICGNGDDGILIVDTNTTGTVVQGNYIGTDASGARAAPNGNCGILVWNGAGPVTIGGTNTGAGNVISGNASAGLVLIGVSNSTFQGNLIGLDATGSLAVSNGGDGLELYGNPHDVTIGGTNAGARNLISGNGGNAIYLEGASNIVVQGNYLGTDLSGSAAVPNGGSGIEAIDGCVKLTIGGTNSLARNLISGNAGGGIVFNGASFSVVQGNYVGTDATGSLAVSNGSSGLTLFNNPHDVTIGGTNSGARNLISGNWGDAIYLEGASNIVVQGNYLGTDVSGSAAVGNSGAGLQALAGSQAITIGGTNLAARNLISGNLGDGLTLNGLSNSVVQGNYIGTDLSGSLVVSNTGSGIDIFNSAQALLLGGTNAGAGNLIAGNGDYGIAAQGPGAGNLSIFGNLIGQDITGARALPNGTGLGLFGGLQTTIIGGTNLAARNYISGNRYNGILVSGNVTGTVLLGNYIGVATDGLTPLGNGGVGIGLYSGARTNSIGGTAPGAGNLISANNGDGIQLSGSGTSYNLVQGNLVGTTRTGSNALGNAFSAVSVFGGASGNTIGGTTAAARNILAAGGGDGVFISDPGTSNNVVQGNYIGTDISGIVPLGNHGVGLLVGNGAASNLMGGAVAGAGNIIAASASDGIQLYGVGTSYNLVQGNFVGTDRTGTKPLGNGSSALSMFSGAQFNTIGGTTAAARNLFSASTNYDGVYLYAATNNTIQGNYIGTDITGLLAFSNGAEGLTLFGASQNNLVGGSAPGAGNTIAASKAHGIFIADPGTSGNLIQGNNIGVGANGVTPLGNAQQGILIDNGAQANVIGLSLGGSGAGNLIADNGFEGIILYNTNTVGNSIRGNAIFNNGNLGLNLVGGIEDGFGVTADHPGGAVPGPNDLQNYPAISPLSYPGTTVIMGTLNSAAGRPYLIDLYWSAVADPSGHGEGQLYLGHANLSTDGAGNGTFAFTTTSNLAGGSFSATATDVTTGDTSEFSADASSTNGPPQFVGALTKGANGFSFSLLLQTNLNYHLQATTNLGVHPIIWSNLTSFVASVSPLQFTDRAATNTPLRFYRAVSP